MKTNNPGLPLFTLLTAALLGGALHLQAQSGPAIAAQPLGQTVSPGGGVTFSVAVEGTGPFTYQWRLNGSNLPSGLITTIAGKSSATFAGDGGPATNASFNYPMGLAAAPSGNLYIADTYNHRIRKVDTNGIVSTLAGSSTAGYSGDGGAATNSKLNTPVGLALDGTGNLYIGDMYNNRVRKLDAAGMIGTVAGVGSGGVPPAYGDGGAATNAAVGYPKGVACDDSGNLYIADSNHSRVRKVDTNGIINAVTGYPPGFSGDGGAATNASLNAASGVARDPMGNLYIADTGNNRVRKVDASGIITTLAGRSNFGYSGDGAPATNATLASPLGVACDPIGNLYIADTSNHRVRKVDGCGIITTLAGRSAARYSGDGGAATNADLSSPSAVAFDGVGNLLIADSGNHRVRSVLLYANYPTLTLSNLRATNAGAYTVVVTSPFGCVTSAVASLTIEAPATILQQPASQTLAAGTSALFSVAVAGSGPFGYLWFYNATNLLQAGDTSTLSLPDLSDHHSGDYLVVVTNAYGSVTSQVATLTVVRLPALLAQPASQAVAAGAPATFTVAADGTGPLTYQWYYNGTPLPNLISTVAGDGAGTYAGDGGPAAKASLHFPQGVGVSPDGDLYIADNNNDRVRKVDANGVISTVAGDGYGASTNYGRFAGDGSAATNASLFRPNNLAWDPAGNLYIADIFNHRVRKVDTNGVITTVAGSAIAAYSGEGGAATNASLYWAASVAVDAAGNLLIADLNNHRIRKVGTNGIITTVAGNGGGNFWVNGVAATTASLHYPQGVSFDNRGNFYIADTATHRIRKVTTNGLITTVAGNGNTGFSGDGGAATNATLNSPWFALPDALGNLYIADLDNNRIRKVDTNGLITTVAGNGSAGFSGDGGPATAASLNNPACVALDAQGNLYIADWENNRVRKVDRRNTPALTLPAVLPAQAGDYSVVVSSPYGSVTSAVATLTVTVPRTPPQLLTTDAAFGFQTNSRFGFNLSAAVGQTIVVEGSSDLVQWVPLLTNQVLTTPIYFFDPLSTNLPARFYRARLP